MATFSREDEILYHAHSYHEAAHAVFAVKVCGGKVWYVKKDGERGECSSSIPIERIESLRPALRFRLSLGHGVHALEVLNY